METKSKVLLVADAPAWLNKFKLILEAKSFGVVTASDEVVALSKLEAEQPDVMVLDLEMAQMRGVAMLRGLKEAAAKTPVIAMATLGKESELDVLALELGAISFLDKPLRTAALLEAQINSVLQLVRNYSAVAENGGRFKLFCGKLWLDSQARQAFWENQPIHLQQKQFDLLEFLMTNPRQFFRNPDILEKALGGPYHTIGVVRKQVCELRRRLPILKEIIKGRDGGYIFEEKVVRG